MLSSISNGEEEEEEDKKKKKNPVTDLYEEFYPSKSPF
eukprot:CAMPEP_0184691194 /NCGR_PEP_ID=MMETSP0313-20130426/104_1 /TAXON_ID=2792 /ORGANISM="Porphyridium aerugineum, Strain SAG 1380-2" /LENGTH=37 /DNA_ID= /DNA_START= /DNA_END= /DNA_ORIENTATION=